MQMVVRLKDLAKKEQILNQAGYNYHLDRALYFNRNEKKAFSVEFVEDQPLEELERRIHENGSAAEWRFFFNSSPSNSVKQELSRVLADA